MSGLLGPEKHQADVSVIVLVLSHSSIMAASLLDLSDESLRLIFLALGSESLPVTNWETSFQFMK